MEQPITELPQSHISESFADGMLQLWGKMGLSLSSLLCPRPRVVGLADLLPVADKETLFNRLTEW